MDQGFTEEEQFYSKNKAILEQLYLYHKLEKEEKKQKPLDFVSFVLKQKNLFDESKKIVTYSEKEINKLMDSGLTDE